MLLAVGQVIFAIRELQSTLQQIGRVVLRIIEARRDPQSKKIRSVKVGVVERIDIGAQASRPRRAPVHVLSWMAAIASRCGRSGASPFASMAASSM